MPVKPEFSHLRTWDDEMLTVTFGWEDKLDADQQTKLPRLRKHFRDMIEIECASLTYYANPIVTHSQTDGLPHEDRLVVRVKYDATVFANDSDSMRQHLDQGIERDIVDVLFGDATIDEKGVIARPPDPDTARPAHIIQV